MDINEYINSLAASNDVGLFSTCFGRGTVEWQACQSRTATEEVRSGKGLTPEEAIQACLRSSWRHSPLKLEAAT